MKAFGARGEISTQENDFSTKSPRKYLEIGCVAGPELLNRDVGENSTRCGKIERS